ncbi:MAG: phosphoesterase PA-phosphatase related protein [Parcubacteria group bacterium]|nr:phosphoesterase PA-phosphatase related protein [Parcubacteria group bacterium]
MFLLVFIFSGLSLITIINGLSAGSELQPFNEAVETLVHPFRSAFLTPIMLFASNVGSPFVLSIVALILAIIIVLHKDTYSALLFVVSMGLSLFAFTFFKNWFHFSRPVDSLVSLSSFGFPSGHATIATTFFFSLSYAFFDWSKSVFARTALVLFSIAAVALICFSRVYLGAHFALDVLAGISLGLLVTTFTALLFNIFIEERSFERKRKRV